MHRSRFIRRAAVRRAVGALALGAATAFALTGTAALAEYPERAVNMVIPYGPGGATDISARAIAEPLGTAVGQALVMANVAGAGGATGSVAVKNAKADGYTMMFARVGSHTVSPAMKEQLPYALDDFRFVGVYEINPVACAVKADSEFGSMDDIAAQANKDAGSVSFASSGVGTLPHIASVMVLREFGVGDPTQSVVHIPQKGGGAAATAVLNGTASFLCTNSSALAGFVANNQLKPLLVTTAEPVVGFDAPTSTDAGKPALQQLVGWTGVAGPKGLPDDVAAEWGKWIATATADETFKSAMEKRGSVIRLMNPEESNAFIQGQYEVFRKLVDDMGIRIKG